jgi:plasmid stability protein
MTRNLTLAIDEELLAQFRIHAAQRRTSVNALVRQMMADAVGAESRRQAAIARMRDMSTAAAARSAAAEAAGTPMAPVDWSREATYANHRGKR